MSEQKPNEPNLAEELRQLGQNLTEAMRTAWERPERKRAQQDIINGLNELGNTLRATAQDFSESTAGQRLKTEAEDFRQRVRSGEVESKVRSELVNALMMMNRELEQAIARMSKAESESKTAESAGAPSEGASAQPPNQEEPPKSNGGNTWTI